MSALRCPAKAGVRPAARSSVRRSVVVCKAQQQVGSLPSQAYVPQPACTRGKIGVQDLSLSHSGLAPSRYIVVQANLGQKLASAGAAALLSLGAISSPAIAGEFDVLGEPTPTANYYIDDANVLSKSTRGDINKRLKALEVRSTLGCRHVPRVVCVSRRRNLGQYSQAGVALTPKCKLQIQTGYRIEVVTVRKLEFETDAFAFADKVIRRPHEGNSCALVQHARTGPQRAHALLTAAQHTDALAYGTSRLSSFPAPPHAPCPASCSRTAT